MIKRMLLLILMVWCPLGLAWAGDWPQWRGPERTGISKETGLLPSWHPGGPKLLWTFRDAGAGLSGMAIVGNRLYSIGAQGKCDVGAVGAAEGKCKDSGKDYVYAVDLNTQKKLWSMEIGPRFYFNGDLSTPTSTPTIDGNFLYALGGAGNLVCVETTTGRKVWSQHLVKNLGGVEHGDTFSESPLVDGELVMVTPGGKKNAIVALDKKTGALKWRCTGLSDNFVSNGSMIAIEVGSVRQYVQMGRGSSMVSVRASDGKLLWKVRTGEYSYCTPVYENDCVYLSTRDGCKRLKLLPDGDKFKTELIYANRALCVDCGGFVLVGEYLYGYSMGIGWICQNFRTGKTVWKKDPNLDQGSVLFADGNLYCYHLRGDVLLLKATPDGYQEQGKFRIPEITKSGGRRGGLYTYLVVANGKLYLRDNDLIFCYDVRKPQ